VLDIWVAQYEIGVVIFDALLDDLGSADVYESRQVRAALRPLRRVARDANVAVLGSLHPRKGDALSFRDLVAGSHQFNAVSRSSLLIAEHPDDKRRRVLLRGKGNLSVLPDPLEFEIKSCTFQLNGALFDQPVAEEWQTAEIELDDVLPLSSHPGSPNSPGHVDMRFSGNSHDSAIAFPTADQRPERDGDSDGQLPGRTDRESRESARGSHHLPTVLLNHAFELAQHRDSWFEWHRQYRREPVGVPPIQDHVARHVAGSANGVANGHRGRVVGDEHVVDEADRPEAQGTEPEVEVLAVSCGEEL
jgi:hypothetical protein